MIGLVVFALVVFLIGAVVAARRVAKVPTVRLVSTKQPPELNIGTGLTWHLFLSHIWSTGQDAVGNIKSELQLLVDDLKDIGSLEEYIQHSQMILFFLSCGYFRSQARSRRPNCLREIRSSLEKDKPIVLVQEADPAKGGATLQALRGECPEDLQPDIFEKGWAHTIYMRIEEFQRAVLLCSPNYLNQTSLPLCVPGEPESQPLAFAKETMLWASPANAGAQVLAEEIATTFAGLTISTADARPATVTHMLLYLNEDSFVSDARLAEQVKQARQDRLKIVMAHENDPDLGGCLFSRFFEVTPQERAGELIADGLYKDLARSCFPGPHHPVSLALLAKDLGATPARSGSVASMSRLSASIAEHGSRLVRKISRSSSATATIAGDGTGGEATVSVDSVEPAASAEAAQEHV
ncbi:hypothetical protein EMIHUDRAFT_367322 [Emiliania huxleyi CCMP1516]|uniref:TIR domain-containing protein n=2 Tax=Emiliania huxleyi TaxID=2903 RepID=A0A0D3JPQ8_EMIH1|nr:hypothetical protein EMIHUDRAFT_367322 [Emiliania huxleyi CCMP1516]EOD25493.1 hypothetical protein EMIHUDRAFT_367322 [Emiliania huxleyi CCMP1516]|eukprot:XP_005777922.1 hypothetical protein EMIHUDRAFT_367322 [Emiliania huxleyi CCMP1516]